MYQKRQITRQNQYTHQFDKQYRLQQSTASISSDNSFSSKSLGKYSFKTGKFKPFVSKHYQFDNQSSKSKQTFIQASQFNNIKPKNHKNQTKIKAFNHSRQQNWQCRSVSNKSSVKYFAPIPKPQRNIYTDRNYISQMQNISNGQHHYKSPVALGKQQNYLLRKSISQKKIRINFQYNNLNSRLSDLKAKYAQQQQKINNLSSVINEYFG